MDATQRHTKYIFLDVVGYSHNRSVEAQTDIIEVLNNIVRKSLELNKLSEDSVILLPVGDGICIAVIDVNLQYDIHLNLGKTFLYLLDEHNKSIEDTMRKFIVRIGLNENVDNLITDINGRNNVAGMGINMAQRIMANADGNQILVGESVYSTLSCREKYMKSFRKYTARIKHGLDINVYQFIQEGNIGLDVNIPSAFSVREKELNRYQAYYIYHALMLKESLIDVYVMGQDGNTAMIILHFLAEDSLSVENASEYDKSRPKLHGGGQLDFKSLLKYYSPTDFWISIELCDFIRLRFNRIIDIFNIKFGLIIYVNDIGKSMLKKYHPDIWDKLSDDLK